MTPGMSGAAFESKECVVGRDSVEPRSLLGACVGQEAAMGALWYS